MRRPLVILVFLLAVGLFAGGVWWFGYRSALIQVSERGQADLRSASDRLIGQIARFRQVAVILADHPLLVALGRGGADAAAARELLLRSADQSGALEIAFVGREGRVLASSRPASAPARRADVPAFRRAMSGALGFGHGLAADGVTRAFRFWAPVFDDEEPMGAVVVSVDMETVEESDWRSSPQVVFFTDRAGEVFVTNRSELLFRRFDPAGGEGAFGPAAVLEPAGLQVWTLGATRYLPRRAVYRELPLPVIGMTGHALTSTRPAERIATLQAVLAAALCLAFGAFLFLATERRRALAEANAGLEARVSKRTEELTRANASLRHEIAERQEAEEALRRAQADLVQAGKLSALGQMSAGISHELNQPLMAIRSFSENAELLLEKERTGEARANLSRISELSRRMDRIIRNLRAFARQEHEPMTSVNIVGVIDAVLELADSRLRQENVAVEWERPSEAVWVRGGEVRLQQVVMNLLSNALDAMSGQDSRRLELALQAASGKTLVTVRDFGPGLDDPDKIFDPFYSTKEVGQSEGMGLGLSISYGLVQSFGGAITGRNHPEGGAVFTVELTAADREAAA